MDLKVAYPEECDDILKELKKGKIKKKDLKAKFLDKHADYNMDILAKHGFLIRTYVVENGKNMIQFEYSGKKDKFKQGQKNYPKKKGGMVL